MVTIKLYDNNSYIKKFTSKVVSVTQKDGYYFIETEATAFFPEGGGQAGDRGTLGGANVVDTQIKDGIIYHKVDAPLNVGDEVEGELDWETRFARMQIHTGEHIITGLIHNKYGYNNVGFHLGHELTTLDVDGTLTDAQLAEIEKEANQVVYQNKNVWVAFPAPAELQTLEYRSKLDLKENVRIVTIEDTDVCACCAPHVAKTGEIGLIKIFDQAPNRGNTRITFSCGMYAFEDYVEKHNSNARIMRLLSATKDKTAEAVEKNIASLASAKAKITSLSNELTYAKLTTKKANNIIFGFTTDAGYDELRYSSNIITTANPDCICVLLSSSEGTEGFIYTVSSVNIDIKDYTMSFNNALNGRGGGKGTFAQGKLTATRQDIIDFINK